MATPARGAPFVIDNDDGGRVDDFIMWYKRLADSGAPVVLRGICLSACTFVLMLPRAQVCVEPTASLGFHIWSVGGHADPTYTAAGARRWYPVKVQEWLAEKEKVAPLKLWPFTYMPAEEIVALDIFPACVTKPVSQE